ncbi:MAG: amidohydrolase family protein [Eubacteriales bacterium]|nr:amidohydrolase family protein [Eubacteriales bacterium]
MDRYEVIDAHAHLIECIKGFGYHGEMRSLGGGRVRWATGEEIQIIPPELGGEHFSYDRLIREMDACGIGSAVLMQGSIYGFQNEYAHEAVCAYPDRFTALGAFDPYCRCYLDIMRRWIEEFRFCGLKFEMSTNSGFMGYHSDFYVNGERMRPVLEYAQKHGLVLSFDIGTFGDPSFQIDRIVALAQKYDGVEFVIEHMFCPAADQDEKVCDALKKIETAGNIYVTLASLPSLCAPETYPYPSALRYIKLASEIIGVDRIMWGSDIPVSVTRAPYSQLISFICEGITLSADELQKIYAGTAKKVYGL